MNYLRGAARWTSRLLGRDTPLINSLRPVYNLLLDVTSGRRGIWQQLNGHERFRIDPWFRIHFPVDKDPAVCTYLRSAVKQGDVCLNIGAHVGIYALCLARWSYPDGHVFAFEPNPTARTILRRHISLNGLADQVTLVPAAVADVTGSAAFFADGNEGTSRLGSPNPQGHKAVRSSFGVRVTTIDAFCSYHALRPDWLLIDVEGYEIRALAGAREAIDARRGELGIVVELHPNLWPSAGNCRADLEHLLSSLSLQATAMEGQADALGEHGIVALHP